VHEYVTSLAALNQSVPYGLTLLFARLSLGFTFFAHGYQKSFRGGGLKGTAGWFESVGVRPGMLNAIMASSSEMTVGVFVALGLLMPLACAGVISLMVVAIVTVHRQNGFFIFNKGEGIEYTLALAVMALLLGTFGAGRYSIDALWKGLKWAGTVNFTVTLVVGVVAAILQLVTFYRPSSVQ